MLLYFFWRNYAILNIIADAIYIVIHRQTCFVLSELYSVARPVKLPKLGLKPSWLKRQFKILPLSHEETSGSEGNLNAYVSHLFLFTYIRLTASHILMAALLQKDFYIWKNMIVRYLWLLYIFKYIKHLLLKPTWDYITIHNIQKCSELLDTILYNKIFLV